MSQSIADASAKAVRSFYPIRWMTDHVFFGLFGPIDGAFWRGRSALKRCEIVQFLLGSYSQLVRDVDDDGLLDLLPRLPEEAQESLMALATGERPEPRPVVSASLVADPFAHPDAQRRFWVASDEEAVAQALEKPWAEWLVFLHPSQRAAVERNFNGPARISGAAGTGKSVVAMHRAAHLARESQAGRILLTTFSKTLSARLSEGNRASKGPKLTSLPGRRGLYKLWRTRQ